MIKKIKAFFIALILLSTLNASSQIKNYPPPGKLVDVNGYKMHLIVKGEDKKGPTVVFFHGAGDIALNWNLVLPKVGKFAKAVAIDFAGEGWSEHGHGLALNQQVYDTYQALKNAKLNGPYILVGHSLGGIHANLFASKYKEEVLGVVMVDATHPDVVLKIFNRETKKMERKKMRLTANSPIRKVVKTHIYEPKETKSFQGKKDFGNRLDKFSTDDKKLFNWIYNERKWTYVPGESNTYEAEIFQEMFLNKQKYHLGDIPLIVISGGNKSIPEGDKNWSSKQLVEHREFLQKDLLKLSSNNKQIIAKKSGHNIHIDEPKLVAKAIKKMVKKMKK